MATQKESVQISGIVDDTDDLRITVIVAATGKPLRLKRRHTEFMPGRVLLPAWYYKSIFGSKREKPPGGDPPF